MNEFAINWLKGGGICGDYCTGIHSVEKQAAPS